ncbi:MAG: DUF3833 domain-containing protein [Dokdonella sp.]
MKQPRWLLTAVIAIAASLALAGCASQNLTGYANEKPVLDLTQYFNGRLDAHGMFQDRAGQVVKRFSVVMDCTWNGDHGVLDEAFTYSDGTTQRRVWQLTKHADGHYTGTAGDIVGQAVGKTSGNVFHWNYTLNLPVDGKTYEVQMDDWMYLMDGKVMLNRTAMSKFGIHLGDITLAFSKP